ncbi:MAG: HD domain-containing protein [Campylobacterota bacterium]|nr:HD domain-containing protein [Campylobacterota bacterium]
MEKLNFNEALPEIQHLIYAIELRDNYTQGHSQRVAEYALILAALAEIDDEYTHEIYVAGLLHDIGKIGIPDAILLKPGKLAGDEYKLVQQHGSLSGKILQKMQKFSYLAPIVKHHHEDYSGKGYPDGLKGENIPLGARVLSIVDVFDALTSKRIYRDSMKTERAISIMDDMQSSLKFDPTLYRVFIKNIDKFINTLNGFTNSTAPQTELQELDFLRNNFFFSDPLTKLLNREGMLTLLKKCSFNNDSIVLGRLDIKAFREYNNLYGSDKGDKLLQNVASILKSSLKALTDIKEPQLNDMFIFRPHADIFIFLSISRKVDFLSYKIESICSDIEESLGVKIEYELLLKGEKLARNIEKQISSLL